MSRRRPQESVPAPESEERVSLAPLEFEEAMRGLLGVKPDQGAADSKD